MKRTSFLKNLLMGVATAALMTGCMSPADKFDAWKKDHNGGSKEDYIRTELVENRDDIHNGYSHRTETETVYEYHYGHHYNFSKGGFEYGWHYGPNTHTYDRPNTAAENTSDSVHYARQKEAYDLVRQLSLTRNFGEAGDTVNVDMFSRNAEDISNAAFVNGNSIVISKDGTKLSKNYEEAVKTVQSKVDSAKNKALSFSL